MVRAVGKVMRMGTRRLTIALGTGSVTQTHLRKTINQPNTRWLLGKIHLQIMGIREDINKATDSHFVYFYFIIRHNPQIMTGGVTYYKHLQ